MPRRTRCGPQLLFSARGMLLAFCLAAAGHAAAVGTGIFNAHPTTPEFGGCAAFCVEMTSP